MINVLEICVGSTKDKIFIVMEFLEHDLKSLMETMKSKFTIGEVKAEFNNLSTTQIYFCLIFLNNSFDNILKGGERCCVTLCFDAYESINGRSEPFTRQLDTPPRSKNF